jgi:hypothetical protein
MTYTELVNAVTNYTENIRGDVGDEYVHSLRRSNAFTTRFSFPRLRKNVTGVTTSGNKYLSCPSDFLSTFSMAVETDDGQEFLLNKDVNFIRQAYPKATDTVDSKVLRFVWPNHNLGRKPCCDKRIELHPWPNT